MTNYDRASRTGMVASRPRPRTVAYFTESLTFGGAEQVLLTLLGGLDRQHWSPLLLHPDAPGLGPLIAAAEGKRVPTRVVPAIRGHTAAIGTLRFSRLLRDIRPAVFHAHLAWPLACRFELVAAALARVPAIIATEHSFRPIPWRRSRRIQRLIACGVDRYVAVSAAMACDLRQERLFPARKLITIRNGIPLAGHNGRRDMALRAELAGQRDRPIILTVARLDAGKGIQHLLAAAALVPKARFIVAGDGVDRCAMESAAAALGLGERVCFLGHRADIPALLRACDLFVHPSLAEGLPLAVLEAMAAGLPIVATAVGGTGEAIVDRESGLLVPAADPHALAAAIRAILQDPVLARRLATAARRRVEEEFTDKIMIQRTVDLYNELLRARHEGTGGQ